MFDSAVRVFGVTGTIALCIAALVCMLGAIPFILYILRKGKVGKVGVGKLSLEFDREESSGSEKPAQLPAVTNNITVQGAVNQGSIVGSSDSLRVVPRSHSECPLSSDILDIVYCVKDASWEALDILRIETRASQMCSLDDGLTAYKLDLEAEYIQNLRGAKPGVTDDEVATSVLIYNVMAEALIRRIMNEVRKYISAIDNPFNPEMDDSRWVVYRDELVKKIIKIVQTDLVRYFPHKFLTYCQSPQDFLTDDRKRSLKEYLTSILDKCRVYSLEGKRKHDMVYREMRQRILRKVTYVSDNCDPSVKRENTQKLINDINEVK